MTVALRLGTRELTPSLRIKPTNRLRLSGERYKASEARPSGALTARISINANAFTCNFTSEMIAVEPQLCGRPATRWLHSF